MNLIAYLKNAVYPNTGTPVLAFFGDSVTHGAFECAKLGHGTGYKYAHDYPNHYVQQQYLPYELNGKEFYKPSGNGYEIKIKEHMKRIKEEAAHESEGTYGQPEETAKKKN